MSKKIILLGLFVGIALASINAQVGIGVANPNTNSILDLTNTNNKGLLLPFSSTQPTAGSYPEGMIFYFDSMVYVRNANGFNGISPWKYRYNGSTNEAVYFNPTSYMGVGIGVNDTAILGNLHISLNSKQVAATGTSAALFIGNSDAGTHLIMDNDEIMVKSTSTTGGILKLQEGAGSVQIGQDVNNPSNLNVFGKVKENGNDLLPQGTVVMWAGAMNAIPNGWAKCDGGRYLINTTTGVTDSVGTGGYLTPDLRERFIVGAGVGNNSTVPNGPFPQGTTGGQITHTLAAANLPSHQHEANGNGATINITSSGAHSHTSQESWLTDNDDNDDTAHCIGKSGGSDPAGNQGNVGTISNTGSNHTHPNANFAGNTGNGVGLSATPVTHGIPPYYALIFIVKL